MTTRVSRDSVSEIDRLIEKHQLLQHPFYRAWTAGQLSPAQLGLYAEQYYQHVRAFPDQLESLAARADGQLRELVRENLAEEIDPAGPHPLLWRRFAAAVGASEAALDSAAPLPGVAALVDTFRDLAAHGSPAEAVAAFYAYEAQVPEIATQKIAGLRRYYAVQDPEPLRYFSVHEEADVRHRAAWRSWLAGHADSDAGDAAAGAERALLALWGALDAIYGAGPCPA